MNKFRHIGIVINLYNEIFKSIIDNKSLVLGIASREIQQKYKESFLGMFWLVINPLLMIGIYNFVFTNLFKGRWVASNGREVSSLFAIFIASIMFNLFSDIVIRSNNIIIINSNYVKKVIFPLEILPITVCINSFFNFLIGLSIWFIAFSLGNHNLAMGAFLLPLILLPYMLLLVGLAWFLAALGVYVRDLPHIVNFTVSALQFLTPIFYPISMLGENYAWIKYFNPIALAIIDAQNLCLLSEPPYYFIWLVNFCLSNVVLLLCYVFFMKTKKGFADVL